MPQSYHLSSCGERGMVGLQERHLGSDIAALYPVQAPICHLNCRFFNVLLISYFYPPVDLHLSVAYIKAPHHALGRSSGFEGSNVCVHNNEVPFLPLDPIRLCRGLEAH